MLVLSDMEQRKILGGRVFYTFKAYEDGVLVEEFTVSNKIDADRERARLKSLGYVVKESHFIV